MGREERIIGGLWGCALMGEGVVRLCFNGGRGCEVVL